MDRPGWWTCRRPSKTDPRVAAYGDVDEANSVIGVALATGSLPVSMVTLLGRIQNELFDLGADLGNPLQTTYAREPLRITAGLRRPARGCL